MTELRETNNFLGAFENDVVNIDESRLPSILNEQISAVERANAAYEEAQRKEEIAKGKVNMVLASANELIKEAKGAGQHTARVKGWGIFKHTSKRDEIDATKANLKELIDCGIHTAEAQKELVEVQVAFANSQTALLDVQKMQMAYQRQIAEAMKFLYLLSAHNMGQTQSILINLEAVLKGASKEKLGEMARQQLLVAMDQIKNQENIMLHVRETEEKIKLLDCNLKDFDDKLEELQNADIEQDELIAKNTESILANARRLDEMDADDDRQDELIAENAEKISSHAKKIEEISADDDRQDELIAQNAESILANAKRLDEMDADDDRQDELIDKNAQEIDNLKHEITLLKEKIDVLECEVNKKIWKIAVSTVSALALILGIIALI